MIPLGRMLRRTTFVTLTALGLSLSPGMALGAAEEQPLTLDATVQAKLLDLLKEYKPATPLAMISEVSEINNKGNFGKSIYLARKAYYALQDSGLLGIVTSAALTDGASAGSAQSLSLCGLLTVVGTAAGTSRNDSTGVIPFGKLFVPFGVRSSTDINRSEKLKQFDTTAAHICAPQPGEQFTYRTETEFHFKISGMFGTTKTGTRTEEVSCKVDAGVQPASGLLAVLRGDALAVTCERIAQGGDKTTSEYVFLRDSGQYLLRAETIPVQTIKVRLEQAAYPQ